ncbi:metallophosphoesterase [Candidatus Woesearchaeota archaeon]|nr:metallophosphoesterase [Candidatus Woesearchaeota archaeon]
MTPAQESVAEQKRFVAELLKRGILMSDDFLDEAGGRSAKLVLERLRSDLPDDDLLVIDRQTASSLAGITLETGSPGRQAQAIRAAGAPGRGPAADAGDARVTVVRSFVEESKKREIQDFIDYFSIRYASIQRLLASRHELSNPMAIARVLAKREKEGVSIIGMVKEISHTKNKNLILTVEDPTGEIQVLISKNKPELYDQALDIVLDEVIGIVGVSGERIVFANNVVWPDVPALVEQKSSPREGNVAFIGDLHLGAKTFLYEKFDKLIKWLCGEMGSDAQRELASSIKYLIFVGDLVEGVGIYPGQEDDLVIKDIYLQYDEFTKFLLRLPKDKKIIICPGNHDAMRVAEPQPPLYPDFAEALYKLPNVVMVSNPSLINIDAGGGFPGFDVLLYHGYSFPFFADNVESIRRNGGQRRVDLIMKFLMKRRHLAPTQGSAPYVPYTTEDPLFIDSVPDFFVSGHIHRTSVTTYRGITMINASCWVGKTDYQEKIGLEPEPARVPIVNLRTRQVKVLKF